MKIALKLVVFLTLLSANLAWAAPKQITLNYQATRNGKPFANIVETYQQAGEAYKIESVGEGVGLAALLGKRILKSEGAVTNEGLQPKHFEQQQGDNEKKSFYADFDWQANQITFKSKANLTTEPLLKGTQDLLSFSYQWMFSPVLDDMTLAVTTGKKLRNYSYKILERDVSLSVDAGQFKTVHLVSANPDGKANEKEFWLAADQFYLPIKIIQRDDGGNVIEQTLTGMQIGE